MIQFCIEQDGNEYHTWCPQLPGCHTHGKTPQLAMHNLKDAVTLYIEDAMEDTISSHKQLFVSA